ncbi:hypothetical protein EASAB2608_00449 [Streptomyces sp. EAS-AB2608]|nr:hypothetical protein EASAB2608_00449 [Streptomyces sp. EAS-AB2608]
MPSADADPAPPPHPEAARTKATVPKRAVNRRADAVAAERMGCLPSEIWCGGAGPGEAGDMVHTGIFRSGQGCYRIQPI